MATRTVVTFEEQNGITVLSDDFIVNPAREVSVVARLIAGTPSSGARVQVTLDELEKIAAGTATWVNSPLGNRTVSSAEKILRPVTGVRLSAVDGTWGFQVRQG
jgi:hypothetical protein